MEFYIPEDFHLISDTWFGRTEILQIANRNFKNVEVMNSELIKRWNDKVEKTDTVIHLGNFAWDPNTAAKVLGQLNGKICFLLGNADDALEEVYEDFDNVEILENEILTLENANLVLCHYPLEVWEGKELGTNHAHGHTTFSHKSNFNLMNRINVCCDFWNYAPIKYSVLTDFINLDK